MLQRMRLPGFGLISVLLVGGCSRAPEVEAAHTIAADAQEGETIFQTRCFVCHGRGGKGNGPASTGLGATVRDLTNASWQDSTSDETIRSVVRKGAQAVGGSICDGAQPRFVRRPDSIPGAIHPPVPAIAVGPEPSRFNHRFPRQEVGRYKVPAQTFSFSHRCNLCNFWLFLSWAFVCNPTYANPAFSFVSFLGVRSRLCGRRLNPSGKRLAPGRSAGCGSDRCVYEDQKSRTIVD